MNYCNPFMFFSLCKIHLYNMINWQVRFYSGVLYFNWYFVTRTLFVHLYLYIYSDSILVLYTLCWLYYEYFLKSWCTSFLTDLEFFLFSFMKRKKSPQCGTRQCSPRMSYTIGIVWYYYTKAWYSIGIVVFWKMNYTL